MTKSKKSKPGLVKLESVIPPKESVKLIVKTHWIEYVPVLWKVFKSFAFIVILSASIFYLVRYLDDPEIYIFLSSLDWYWYLTIPALLIYFMYSDIRTLVLKYINDLHSEMAITDGYIISVDGYLKENVHMLDLKTIEYSSVSQTYWGKFLGYGDVYVSTYGNRQAEYYNTQNPHKFKEIITEQSKKLNS